MNPSELLAKRRPNWEELEKICSQLASSKKSKVTSETMLRFASLYRSACADLALAEAYQLPPTVVEQLQQLVAKSHSILYVGRSGHLEKAFREIPRAVATDPYVHTAFVIFWGLFISFCWLIKTGAAEGLAESIVGDSQLAGVEQAYAGGVERTAGQNAQMAGFYVRNNTGIGLMCFALSVLVLPGLAVLVSNAVQMGATFGYMLRDDCGPASDYFQQFVMSHGPFELSAIVLSAGAGLRIGMSWIDTRGLSRSSSLLRAARRSLPVLMLAVLLFLAAAAVEGMLSALNFGSFSIWFKGFISWFCGSSLMFYIVIFGIVQPKYANDLELDPDSIDSRERLWI